MMKLVAVAIAMLAGSTSALNAPISQSTAEWALREHFESFVKRFAKEYSTKEERDERFWIFAMNMEKVVSKNSALAAKGRDQVHGVTKFSDMTDDEFRNTMLNPLISRGPLNTSWPVAKPFKKATDSSFDWRDQNVVTPVKNQLHCGSCWAHSAVETLESAFAINGGDLTELSVQQVVSCDTTDQGCNGGWYYTAWDDYIEKNGGVTTQDNYPYTSGYGNSGECNEAKAAQVVEGTKTSGYSWGTTPCSSLFCSDQNEDLLKDNLVSYGPISIACDASAWSSYTGGVVTSDDCSSSAFKLDHAIQLVGYNTDASTPYWIVRNSWDTTWGNEGYIYLAMGTNTCGIADKPAFVHL